MGLYVQYNGPNHPHTRPRGGRHFRWKLPLRLNSMYEKVFTVMYCSVRSFAVNLRLLRWIMRLILNISLFLSHLSNVTFTTTLSISSYRSICTDLDWPRRVEYPSSGRVPDPKSVGSDWNFFGKVSGRVEKLDPITRPENPTRLDKILDMCK